MKTLNKTIKELEDVSDIELSVYPCPKCNEMSLSPTQGLIWD